MHHVVIIFIYCVIVVLTLCYSIMSHATPIFYYHVFMLTTYLLNIMCTLIAIGMIIGRLECI